MSYEKPDSKWERKIYDECEARGYFEIDGNRKLRTSKENKIFCIMMPPPNVTGVLHIGHALTFTLQDIMTRYMRMRGYETLWQPGLDHAGIATQNVVEKQLLEKGIKKEDIGREEFVKKVWEWKEESGGKILEQMRIMGFSPAFRRTRFTMDEGLANAVKTTFKSLYDRNLIYRGEKMINWCTKDGALSDIEVDYHENKSKLYYLRYFIVEDSKNLNKKDIESKSYIIVATTRPETFFGDTAVMVNPDDERYRHLIGRKVRLPLIDREIEIIADSAVDMEFGTGAVKVTPAHDMNDYEVMQRHNLDSIVVFDKHGILNSQCGVFEGRERLEAREDIILHLEKLGFIEKIEDYENKIGKCYRCGNIIEPYISKQWFVKKDIAKGAIDRVNRGESRFYPAQWKNNYDAWMSDLRDWCISRQLWWGHRIPVFYCECGHEFVSIDSKHSCPKCGGDNVVQDSDVLDTWFSSALWSHSTLGFGNGDFGRGRLWNDGDLEKFHPNSLLITGFDILFFWVARMLMSADVNMNEIAFKDIYLHALVLDEKGNKMSKSKGNVIDPLTLCETFGADVVRFTLAFLCIQGRDIRLSSKQLEITRNFTNKLYNAASFLDLYAGQQDSNYSFKERKSLSDYTTPLGIYMKSRLNHIASQIREALDSYRFDLYAGIVYKFLWNEFCDLGVEFAKASKESIFELASVFIESMKLLHPLMPFISEYLFHKLLGHDIDLGLQGHDSIMIESFIEDRARDEDLERAFDVVSDIITTTRRMRANLDINGEIDSIYIELDGTLSDEYKAFIKKLCRIKDIVMIKQRVENSIADVGQYARIYIKSENLNLEALKARILKQEEKVLKEIQKLEGMLNNQNFIKNAPKELIETNKQNLAALQERAKKIAEEKRVFEG